MIEGHWWRCESKIMLISWAKMLTPLKVGGKYFSSNNLNFITFHVNIF